ncbi:MAG: cadmium-translocating P-type ATPase [Clostridia bacterium]|nr:cadmium-translocating P-type ATPase [Clostridia bacterium]
MSNERTLIKINSEVPSDKLKEILSKINAFEGVISAKVKDNLLQYELSEWASDYDIMVQIINAFEESGYDVEPLFEGGEEVADAVSPSHERHEHHEHEHCEHEQHEDGDEECHGHCDCEHEHHHAVSCGCGYDYGSSVEDLSNSKERKIKLIELSISLIIMIVGVILSKIERTAGFSNYVLVIAYAVAGYNAIIGGIVGIFKRKPFNENTLMTISSISAIILGETLEAVGIMLLFQVGELFEHTALSSADKIINELKSFKEEKVSVIGEGGIEKKVLPESVSVGDLIVLRPGEKNVLDGVIESGSSSFDTMVITGESAYRDLQEGDMVLGGFIAIDGSVKLRVTKSYSESAVNTIAKTIEECAKNKSKSEKFLDKFSKWYTPLVVAIALIVAFIFPIFSSSYGAGLAVWGKRAVMILCVSCPCSILVSVPLAYFIGVANSAKNGVIIKSSLSLEQLSTASVVAFDKTGTLTEGVLKVSKIVSVKKYQGKVLQLVNACEKYSNHPIALAIRKKAGVSALEITEYKEYAGKGVSCTCDGKTLLAGNERFLNENGVKVTLNESLGIKLFLAVDGEYAGAVILNDTLRRTARGMILELKDLGVSKTVMLTGDNKAEASAVKEELGIDSVRAELLPEDKVSRLEKIIAKSDGTVVYLGDGVNDSPVLKLADVGIAMGNGLDVAIESADAVLTTGDLSKIPYIVRLAKRTSSIVKQNLYGSIIIKFLIMALSVTGVVSSLWFAIAGDVGLLIVTIFNSLRNKFKAS